MRETFKSTPEEAFLLEHFFDISPDLLCIVSYDGYFKKINPAVSKLLGYSNAELYSTPLLDFIYESDKEITEKMRNEANINKPLLNFENRYVKKNGEIVWLSWTSTPIESQKLICAIAKNITHTKKHEEERNLLLTNFAKINNDLKKRSYTNSHDLRSPVNNLLSILNLLDISKIEDTETIQFIEMLKLTSENINQALNDYVDNLLLEENSITQIEELSLNDSYTIVCNSINSLIQDSKTTLLVDFSKLKKINFNKVYLESIFLNLITNSIKYAMPGRLPIISIHSKITDGIGQLIFSDNGVGFNMNLVKNKIFKLHQKFHNHIDSKGIGLYLVYNHITSLGGTITVESEVNVGTKFTISFKN